MSTDRKLGKTGTRHGGKNIFGGSNSRGLYVPISEDEQEVLHRLVDAEDIRLIIHGWGVLERPKFLIGDHRVGVRFRLSFNRPPVPMPVWFFDLELQTRTGITLVKERLPSIYGGKPIQVAAGTYLDMQWDIALHSMDPRLVKLLKPGAIGLTSRRQDRDTGLMTTEGNMKLTGIQKAKLQELEDSYQKLRKADVEQVVKATKAAGYEVKRTKRGLEAPDL